MEKIIHLSDTENLPLSSNQKRLWVISQLDNNNPAYNILLMYHLEGEINITAFRESLSLLFERQHTMFSVFRQKEGLPYIDIVRRPVVVEYNDLSTLQVQSRREQILSFAGDDSRKCFDIENGPLYRLYLLKEDINSYFFCATVHHLIFDGYSRRLFVQELSLIYSKLVIGDESRLEPLEFHSYDFSEDEKKALPPDNEKELIDFWKENLAGVQPVLKFPYDYPRNGSSSGLGCREHFMISKECSEKLQNISKESGTSLFNTLLSALGILLRKYTGEDDVCIGVPVSIRRSSSSLKTFGLFVNTIVVRLKNAGEKKFREHIEYTTSAFNNAMSHSKLPFEKIVEAIKVERISGINPLFQISFSWVNNLIMPMDLGGISGKKITVSKGISPFDITFYMWGNGSHIEGEIEYNIDILKRDTVIRLKNNFLNLINTLVLNNENSIDSLSMISDDEIRMINEVNSTHASYSEDETIVRLFEERAEIDPGRTAISFDGIEMTYSELNEKADNLSEILRSYNIGNGEFVGLLMKRSPELIICLLALFKTGAAYVPLNLTDPENRIMSIIDIAKIKFVITNTGHEVDLTGKCERLNIEELADRKMDLKIAGNKTGIKSADPAYIIFTSGTTGTPKGVLVNHKSVINLIEWVNKTFEISHADKLLWVTNLSFDLSVYDIFGILAAGGIVRILNDEDRQNPEKQYDILLKEGITFWDSAPQSLQQVTPFFKRDGDPGLYSSLRIVFLSGDWIPLTLPETITSVFNSAKVVGLGGATEATVWSNYFVIDKINPDWKSIPYGKPIQNAKYFVLDEKMNHCRINQPGNLYIGGDCLALGYYNDPVLTNSKFIPDPYNKGSKLYLTGDKAQWMEDGNIEFLGRDDEQIKVRGYRVEIGEIKNVVLQNKAVKDAIVIPDKSDRHNIKVILFIITNDNIKLDIKELRKELRRSLPEYMIPADVIQCIEFPVTSNGKIDTKGLLSQYVMSLHEDKINIPSDAVENEVKNMSLTERKLYKIWSNALKITDISINDSFFDIGGNSLLTIRVINLIKEEFGFILTFREFITNSTINQLGSLIENQCKSAGKDIKLVHLTGSTNLPLTQNQKRLWLISKLQPDIPTYIISFTYQFRGSLNLEVFRKSIDLLFQWHHIMFSVVSEVNGEPYFDIVHSKADISFHDFSVLPENEKTKMVNDTISADSRKAFNLKKDPLYRLHLIMTGVNEYYFHISIHHIIFDGWSWSVFVKDLNNIYNSLLNRKEIDREKNEFQQYDYAQWEKNNEGDANDSELIEFWKKNLEGASPVLNFPFDFQRKDQPSGRGSYEPIRLSKELSGKLRKISKTNGSSLFTTLLSIFGILIQRYSREDDFNIGLPVAYRPHTKLENIFGMFVNTVVVRLRFEKEFTFRDIINSTSDAALNAIAHQDLTFEKVVEIVNPERSSKANPLFQVGFAWQNYSDIPFNLNEITSERIIEKDRNTPFDLILYLWENEERIEGEFGYSTDLLKHDTVLHLKSNFLHLINILIENPDMVIESMAMISDGDKLIIDRLNETRTNYPKDKTIIQLFEEQVNIYPDKTAVVYEGSSLTYKQLNERTNQLARTLKSSGVSANTPVGILAEKSIDMIVGIIGILKSGGGYVPIDPEYPEQRMNFIISDSGCRILLTQDKYLKIPAQGVTKINLNSPSSFDIDKSNLENINSPADMAYIMYTSGTTGIPKGSVILQYGVNRLVRNINYMDLTSEDKILLTGAIVFDATTFEIWGALLNGGTLYLVDKETILNYKALGEELQKNDITILWLTSALLTQIAESRTDIFNKLKYLLTGGDILSVPHINKVRRENPDLKVINCYGPTENTTFSTTYLIEKEFSNNIPIGKPVSNSTTYIFDRNLNYQPIGVIGELYVGGDGLSKGYLNREDLNKKSFIDHPYISGERLYKTGDYARWLPDGNIEFHGRIDNQLKIRGFRVEIGEVEAVISEIEGVIETVIKPIKINDGDTRLAAFLNVSDTFNMDTKDISRRIKEKLPPYMVPFAFKFMNGFPKTVNGKIDKNALILDTNDHVEKESQDLKEFTPVEKIIYEIWCEALKTKDITTTDNFFEVGGNSLLAISVFSKIESAFNVDLGLRVFFDGPRIKDLAEIIEISKHKTGDRKSQRKTESEIQIIDGEI